MQGKYAKIVPPDALFIALAVRIFDTFLGIA